MSAGSPLPDVTQGLDAWIAERLATDDYDTNPRWKNTLTKTGRLGTAAEGARVRNLAVNVTPALARALSAEAAKRDMARLTFARLILVNAIAVLTGDDRDVLLGDLPPVAMP
jgi:hypothetical protein